MSKNKSEIENNARPTKAGCEESESFHIMKVKDYTIISLMFSATMWSLRSVHTHIRKIVLFSLFVSRYGFTFVCADLMEVSLCDVLLRCDRDNISDFRYNANINIISLM